MTISMARLFHGLLYCSISNAFASLHPLSSISTGCAGGPGRNRLVCWSIPCALGYCVHWNKVFAFQGVSRLSSILKKERQFVVLCGKCLRSYYPTLAPAHATHTRTDIHKESYDRLPRARHVINVWWNTSHTLCYKDYTVNVIDHHCILSLALSSFELFGLRPTSPHLVHVRLDVDVVVAGLHSSYWSEE
jgi:hypothetical protein